MAFAPGLRAARAGYRLEAFDTIGSTNDEALARARLGETGPLWFVTVSQTRGRGRRGRSWQGPPGNLAASLLLSVDVPVAVAATLGFVAGLALSDALATFDLGGARIALKWPNDVLADDAKLSGIMLESETGAGAATAVVVGIGVNVATAPQGVPYRTTSLAALGATVTAEDLFAALSDGWTDRFGQWDEGRGMEAIRSAWLDRAAGVGAPVAVVSGSREIRGIFETLDSEGRLVVRTAGGTRVPVAAGEIHFGDAASLPAAG